MGNDWGELERGGRPRWGLIIFILIILTTVTVFARCSPSETRIPRSVTSPDWPKQTLSPAFQSPVVPLPRPEREPHKPTSSSLTIYVVSEVNNKYWGVSAAMDAWKTAKYTNFKSAAICPVAFPCIKVVLANLPRNTAAQAEFGYRMQDLVIKVNPLITNQREARSAVAHEFGHLIGAPHIEGTKDTVMNSKGVYQVLPTKSDIQTVDRLGHWQLEKMYESSGKTVAVRALPN